VSGNLNWNIGQELQTKTWNPGDLGYYSGNNNLQNHINVEYSTYEPKGWFLQTNSRFSISHNQRYDPWVFEDLSIDPGFWGKLKSQANVNANIELKPYDYYDFFEPRNDGYKLKRLGYWYLGLGGGSDDRKPFYFYLNLNIAKTWYKYDDWFQEYNFTPNWRINDHLSIWHTISYSEDHENYGYVDEEYDRNGSLKNVIIGKRNLNGITNAFNLTWGFNAKSSLSFRMRHYWNKIGYTEFFNLLKDGNLEHRDLSDTYSENFNSFNIDLIYSLQFAPGSFLTVTWKNNLLNGDNQKGQDYFTNLNKVFENPHYNTLSVKAIYYLDYAGVKRFFKR
jgi:hypothetical protein